MNWASVWLHTCGANLLTCVESISFSSPVETGFKYATRSPSSCGVSVRGKGACGREGAIVLASANAVEKMVFPTSVSAPNT